MKISANFHVEYKIKPRSCKKNLHKWNCLAVAHLHTHTHLQTHTYKHTRNQHIRFQSINMAYTQREQDAAAGDDKQTSKQTEERNRTDAGTIHKCEQRTWAEKGGGVAVFLAAAAAHLDRIFLKMDQYFAAAKTLTCQQLAARCVLARTIVCGIVTVLGCPPCHLIPALPHCPCQHLGMLFFSSLSSQRVKSELDFSSNMLTLLQSTAATLKWQLATSVGPCPSPLPYCSCCPFGKLTC